MPHLTKKLKSYYQNSDLNELNDAFIKACEQNSLSIIRYLLTSPDLTMNANIHIQNDLGLRLAGDNKHFKIVNYLLSSDELTDHANVHIDNDFIFVLSCENRDYEFLRLLFKLSGKNKIHFQEKEHNIEWAMSKKMHELVFLMFKSLYEQDIIQYLEKKSVIKNYCEQHSIDYINWENSIVPKINISIKEEFIMV